MHIERLHVGYLPQLLAMADFGCVIVVYVAYAAFHGDVLTAIPSVSMAGGSVAALCVLLSAFALGLYERRFLLSYRLTLRTAIALVGALAALIILPEPMQDRVGWGPTSWALVAAFWFMGLLGNRAFLGRMLLERTSRRRVMALCGEGEMREIRDLERDGKPPTFKLACRPPLDQPEVRQALIRRAASAMNLDEIVVSQQEAQRHHAGLLACRVQGIQVTEAQAFVERERKYIPVASPEAALLVTAPGRNALSRAVKRVSDVVISLALIVFTLPVTLAAAISIWVVDRGPVFYRQVRVGRGGKPFTLLKFRSMRVDAEADGLARWAGIDDPRVTPIGAFLRRSRIDELPQLLNILRGEMSLVGPRPERPTFVEQLAAAEPLFITRQLVPPGVTGWAQVNYPYAASIQDSYIKSGYDLYYVKHSSILLDFIILLMTVRVIVMGEGAR